MEMGGDDDDDEADCGNKGTEDNGSTADRRYISNLVVLSCYRAGKRADERIGWAWTRSEQDGAKDLSIPREWGRSRSASLWGGERSDRASFRDECVDS